MERKHGLIAGSTKRKWKDHRKFFNFSFSLTLLNSFVPNFIECSDILCQKLKKETEEFDFLLHAKKISFDILSATLMETKTKDLKSEKVAEEIIRAFEM